MSSNVKEQKGTMANTTDAQQMQVPPNASHVADAVPLNACHVLMKPL